MSREAAEARSSGTWTRWDPNLAKSPEAGLSADLLVSTASPRLLPSPLHVTQTRQWPPCPLLDSKVLLLLLQPRQHPATSPIPSTLGSLVTSALRPPPSDPFPRPPSQPTFSCVSRMDIPLLLDPAPQEASDCPPCPLHATLHPSAPRGISDPLLSHHPALHAGSKAPARQREGSITSPFSG